ncbi:hypothetical protein ES707_12776 [subsurface metagenome]
MRNRRGLNRIGILAMALLLALGAMGTAYGAWVDEIYIEGTLSTGDISAGLTCGTCWEEPDTPDTDIDCTGGSMTLNIDVTSALEDVDYYCNFIVSNAAGSLPIKIKSMNITDLSPGVSEAIEDLTVGDVIDPGTSATGKVHISLTTDDQVDENLAFTLTVSVERWNE